MFHAQELDRIGSLYYSQESFDNFYFGKGSTYPDFNGAVGFLFEQASSRGHVQNTDNGRLTFPFAIRNQFTAAYSTVLAGFELRKELLEHQRTYYLNAQSDANSSSSKGYIWSAGKDRSKAAHFVELLTRQQLEVYRVASDQRMEGKLFSAENSYFVPLQQTNNKMVRVFFEKQTSFTDSLFYDVSAWTLPLAMNISYAELRGKTIPQNLLGDRIKEPQWPVGKVEKSDYAYALRWDDYYAPKALNIILNEGIVAKVANKSFSSGSKRYNRGTVIIPTSNQKMSTQAD